MAPSKIENQKQYETVKEWKNKFVSEKNEVLRPKVSDRISMWKMHVVGYDAIINGLNGELHEYLLQRDKEISYKIAVEDI